MNVKKGRAIVNKTLEKMKNLVIIVVVIILIVAGFAYFKGDKTVTPTDTASSTGDVMMEKEGDAMDAAGDAMPAATGTAPAAAAPAAGTPAQ